MKNFPSSKMKLVVGLMFGFAACAMLFAPHAAFAILLDGGGFSETPPEGQQAGSKLFALEKGLNIQGLPDLVGAGPAKLIIWTFYLGLSFVGVLALIMIVVGGIEYITGGANPGQQTSAKNRITAALSGLVLALGSYVLLYAINPDLVRLKEPSLPCYSCDCVKAKKAAPKVTLDNCIEGSVQKDSASVRVTTIEGSGDECLIAAAKEAKDSGQPLLQVLANKGCHYVGIRDDDRTQTSCAVYCMWYKSRGFTTADTCQYAKNPGGACAYEWGKAKSWKCAGGTGAYLPDSPPYKYCDNRDGSGSGDDEEAGQCSYLASYVQNAIDLKGGESNLPQQVDLCKCTQSGNSSDYCVLTN